jgi:hypothetical protein
MIAGRSAHRSPSRTSFPNESGRLRSSMSSMYGFTWVGGALAGALSWLVVVRTQISFTSGCVSLEDDPHRVLTD